MDRLAGERPLILIVDDHHDTAQVLQKLILLLGYRARVAEGRRAALEIARAERISILLTDLELSDGDGCDLLAEINALYPVKGIVLTGHGMPADRQRCEAAGFVVFLLKPVRFDDLKDALDAVAAGIPSRPGIESHRPESTDHSCGSSVPGDQF
jgi:two-component system sensor histidine kinase TorS